MLNVTTFYNNICLEISKLKLVKRQNLYCNIFAYETKKYQEYINGLSDCEKVITKVYKKFSNNQELSIDNLEDFVSVVIDSIFTNTNTKLLLVRKKLFRFVERKHFGYINACKKVIRLIDKAFRALYEN